MNHKYQDSGILCIDIFLISCHFLFSILFNVNHWTNLADSRHSSSFELDQQDSYRCTWARNMGMPVGAMKNGCRCRLRVVKVCLEPIAAFMRHYIVMLMYTQQFGEGLCMRFWFLHGFIIQVVVSNTFFNSYRGKLSNLTSIFYTTQLYRDYFIRNYLRIPIKQPGFIPLFWM